MKELMALVAQCKADLDSLGIRYGTVRNWEINTRARCRWGQCKQIARGIFDISIAQRLLEDAVDDQAAKDTIVHELLHTVPGAFDHQSKWKALAQAVNAKLPGYHIKRTTSVDEKGVQAVPNERTYRYELRCEGCGSIIRRERESNLVKHPEHYRCAHCGGEVKRIQ